jgi:outer membrane protein insertion porin family
MLRLLQNILFLMLFFLMMMACTGTKLLPKGEKLFTGAEIQLESSEKVNKKFIKSTAETGVRPEKNKVYLGMRPKLWMNLVAGENPKTKIKKWLKKTGEPPVLMRDVKPGVTCAIIDAKLFNIGIFKSFTESKIIEQKHTFKVIYTSHVHKPFVVKDLSYSISDDSISHLVLADKAKTIIRPGDDYNLDKLKIERIRIDALLKNNGYFYFNPDYLIFKADTSNKDRNVSFNLTLKDSFPLNAKTIYRINNVFINQNYSLNERRKTTAQDTSRYENVIFLGKETQMKVRPEVIMESVYLRKPEVFSRTNHNITLNRLMSLGNFKLVQISFSEKDAQTPGLLDVNILMTPLPKRTFRAGIDLVTKSNNFTGPRLNISLLNRNTFKGAELLSLNMAGSFEAQLGGIDKNLYSYSWNPQVELSFPRFLLPFKLKRTSSIYIPRTRLLLSYNYLKRVSYFDMNTFQFVYGFKWKENIRKEHELNPIDVSYTTVRKKSVEFLALENANPFLKKSYEEKFIAGGSYSFTYNEQVETGKKVQYYFHLNSEMTGNLFSLAKIITGGHISSVNPATIAGSPYSQYAKLSIYGRGYYNFINKNKLAFRLFAGVAVPYGNSSVLPYSKQFFSGGPNSLRAFQINSVGPGTFYQNTANNGFSQLGGDLKLEINSEYRFNIFRYLKGALFLETGNVWLLKSNPSELGSPFVVSKFLDDLAVGTGAGLRVDVSFFILRFDLAMPLRKPWLAENSKWVINQMNFGDSTWRRENLILNVAIGYPF